MAKRDEFDGYKVVPASTSQARAATVLPTKGSEDVTHLLEIPTLPKPPPIDARDRYGPTDQIEWVIDITFPPDTAIRTEDIDACADLDLAELYGIGADDDSWCYVHAADAPQAWTRLAVGRNFVVETHEDDPTAFTEQQLSEFLERVHDMARSLHAESVMPRLTPAAAAQRSRELFELWRPCSYESVVVLVDPKPGQFDGRDIWDVMLCLGLRWGDCDLFHWPNPSDEVGGDYLFSVWTSTEPGYFLPERIAAGEVCVQDLCFGFSVRGSPAPASVLSQMMRAVEYVQRRLGGAATNAAGEPFSIEREQQVMGTVVERLQSAGFKPGVHPLPF